MRTSKYLVFRFLVFVLLLGVVFFTLIGCDSDVSTTGKKTGAIRIVFPENSRSLLNSEAASLANTYGVAVWNSDGNIVTLNSIKHNDEIPLISLAAGTYKVIGVASHYGETVSIVGAGYVSDVVVESNQTTDVEITLSAPTVVIDVPDTAYESETIDIPFYASFGDIPLSIAGGYYYLRNADGSTYRYNGKGTISNVTSVLMPLTEGEYYFDGFFSGMQIIDDCFDYGHYNLSFEGTSWGFSYVSEEYEEYNEMFHQRITVIKRPTSLAVSFKWAED